MVFKVDKNEDKPELKLVSFRLPVELMKELDRIADKEDVSTTKLVRQMLRYGIVEYEKQKK